MQFRFLLPLGMVVAMSALLRPQSETNYVPHALLLVANKGEHTLGLIDRKQDARLRPSMLAG